MWLVEKIISMSTLTVAFCYLLCIMPVLPSSSKPPPTLPSVISSLKHMFFYYKSYHKNMNLDGVYGLRVMHDYTNLIIKAYDAGRYPHLSEDIADEVRALAEESKELLEIALPSLKKLDQNYYDKMGPLLDKTLETTYPYRRIEPHLKWNKSLHVKNNEGFGEEESDHCFGELLGTHPGKEKCDISPPCLELMFHKGYDEYALTHQLLYIHVAEEHGCTEILNKWLESRNIFGGTQSTLVEFCTNSFYEMCEKVQLLNGEIIPIYHDLFMEQEFVCPSLGFMEFLHNDFLSQILSWQRENGCYGKSSQSPFGRLLLQNETDMHYDYDVDEDSEKKKENVIIQQAGDNKLEMIQGDTKQHQFDLNEQKLTRDDFINRKNPKIDNVFKDSNQNNMVQDMDQKQAKALQGKNSQYQNELNPREKQEQPDSNLKQDNQAWWNERKGDRFHARRLLFERTLEDGCLSHKTAVAAGALTQYLRFMIDPGPPEYREAVSLNGINRLLKTELSNEETANEKDGNVKPMIDLDEKTFQEVKDPHVEKNDDANDNKEEEGEEEEEDEDENEDEGLEKEEEDYYEDDTNRRPMGPNDKDNEQHKKFLPGVRAPNMPRPWQDHQEDTGDKEYEQYIDEDAIKKDKAVRVLPRPHLDTAGDKSRGNIGAEKYAEEDDYNYYDNRKGPNEQELSDDLDDNVLEDKSMSGPHSTGVGRMDNQPIDIQSDNLRGVSPQKIEAGGIGKVYLIVFSITVVLLYFMYRFVKKRRIIIRYRYR